MIELRREDNQVAVKLNFSQDKFYSTVDICKDQGGKFDAERKLWTFPLLKLPSLLKEFKKVDEVNLDFHCATYLRDQSVKLSPEVLVELETLAQAKRENGQPLLLPLQLKAVEYYLKGGRLNTSALGTGKSIVTTCALLILYKLGKINKFLILCPKSVFSAWTKELSLISSLLGINPIFEIITKKSQIDREGRGNTLSGVLITPQLFRGHVEALKALYERSTYALVLDEAHVVKNPKSLISQALREMNPHHAFGLTATLIPKNVEDLWNVVDWLYPGYLGTSWEFNRQYLVTIPQVIRTPQGKRTIQKKVGYKNLKKLKSLIEDISFRQTRDSLNLPPATFLIREVEMTTAQRRLYNAVKDSLWHDLRHLTSWEVYEMLASTTPLTKAIRLIQAANDPSLFGEEESTIKLDELDQVLEDTDEQVIIWTQWVKILDKIKARYGDEVEFIRGDVSAKRRIELINEFQSGNLRLLAGNAAMSEGVTLTNGTLAAILDRGYSAKDYYQLLGRNHRLGQDKPVTYINFTTKGTVDELPLRVVESNIELMLQLQGESDGGLITKQDIESLDILSYFRK